MSHKTSARHAGWLLLAVMLVVLAACTQNAGETATTDDCVADGTCAEGPDAVTATTVQSAGETYQGLPVGLTEEGYPYIGDPNAPVVVEEFTDFLCPFCYRHTTETTPALLNQYASSGQVQFVFRDFPLAGLHPTAPSGHNASLCVAEQGAPLFWEFHSLLFTNQAQWAGIPDPTDYLSQAAQQVGVDIDAYQSCVGSPETSATITQRVADAQSKGYNGTPTFQLVTKETGETYDLVGAQPLAVFASALDALLAGEVPAGLTASSGAASQDAAPIPSFTVDPDSQDTYDGLTVGFTEEGFPFIGSPEAPVTLMEYSDYLCPFCFRHTTQTTPALIEQYVRSGEANFVFRDLPLVGLHPTAPTGHEASVCVAEQGAAYFWAYHDTLFFSQQQWENLADPSEYLAQTAENIGVDMAAYEDCVTSGRAVPIVDARVAEGRAAGFNGTPSFQFLDNASGEVYELVGAHPVERFQEYFDALVAGEAPPEAVAEEQSEELPLWASEEGLAPDSDRPGYTVAGDPYKGDPDAPLIVVEFSDLQCPSCQRHALEAQPVIDETFVDTGQIMWVFKHFPLRIHPQSAVASAAAECGGDQGKFFEMEALLFANQEEWSIDDPDPVFVALAEEAGLDGGEFAQCLAGRAAFERVLADIYDGTGVLENTPTFVMIYGGQGRRLEGARDADDFVAILQAQLDSALTVDSDS